MPEDEWQEEAQEEGEEERVRRTATLAALAACCGELVAVASPVAAQPSQPATSASIHPSFFPNRLGASTAFTLAINFSGGSESVPAPLRHEVLHLAAGLGIHLRGVRTCAKSRLQRKGAAGCPKGSLVGRGHALAEARTGSLTTPEQVTISVFRGPNRHGRPVLEILGQGYTPLWERTVSTAVLAPDRSPYGTKVTVSVPRIPTLRYEPDASLASLSLTLGHGGHGPRAHTASAKITVPRRCPGGGFPFTASFDFADGSSTSASASIACP
jgi:hypothetical protein